MAIESVVAYDLAKGLDHLAMHWTEELAPLNKSTGIVEECWQLQSDKWIGAGIHF